MVSEKQILIKSFLLGNISPVVLCVCVLNISGSEM
jgi:hypothetical protein